MYRIYLSSSISRILKPYATKQTSVINRCSTTQAVQPWTRYTPPPPYTSATVNIRPLSHFFLIFSDFFSLSDCSNVLSKSRYTSCNIILLSYTSYCFTLMLLYAVCVWTPFIIFIIKGRAVFAVAHFFLYVTFFFMGFGLDIFPLFI